MYANAKGHGILAQLEGLTDHAEKMEHKAAKMEHEVAQQTEKLQKHECRIDFLDGRVAILRQTSEARLDGDILVPTEEK